MGSGGRPANGNPCVKGDTPAHAECKSLAHYTNFTPVLVNKQNLLYFEKFNICTFYTKHICNFHVQNDCKIHVPFLDIPFVNVCISCCLK